MRADLSALIGQMYGGPAPDGEAASPRVTLDELLLRVLAEGASDLHLTAGSAPAMRVQGELRRIEGKAPLNGYDGRRHVLATWNRTQHDRILASGELSSHHGTTAHGTSTGQGSLTRNTTRER